MYLFFAPFLWVLAVLLPGCEIPQIDEDSASGRDASAPGTICDEYLVEYCAFGVECGILRYSRAECERRFASVPCVSERIARDCSEALAQANCLHAPRGCDLVDALDRSEAEGACSAFSDALCRAEAECGGDYDFCRLMLREDLPCEFVVTTQKDLHLCLEAIDQLRCNGNLPDACEGLFVFP
jgi:hypothetical protein